MMNGGLLAAAPTLANLRALATNLEWMNGVQFYLHRNAPTTQVGAWRIVNRPTAFEARRERSGRARTAARGSWRCVVCDAACGGVWRVQLDDV